MAKIPVFNSQGEKIKDQVFKLDFPLNEALVSQVLRVEQANFLKKSGKAKTKADVSGGGRKPWRQKGTGRARAGSIRSPLFKGGGVTFGPTGEKRTLKLPVKMKKKAYLELLSWQAKNKNILIIENIAIKSGKTKDAEDLLSKLVKNGRGLLIVDRSEISQLLPWRNLALLDIKILDEIDLVDLTGKAQMIISLKAADKLRAQYNNV